MPSSGLCAQPLSLLTSSGLCARHLAPDGEVIITITLFGRVTIELMYDAESKARSALLPSERVVTQGTGDAYAIWSKARWKMKHDAIVEPKEPAISGLENNIARVGLTFRYVRRSFLELEARSRSGSSSPAFGLSQPGTMQEFNVMDIVDARYFEGGQRSTAHLYTYPAVVLYVDPVAEELTLQYLCDGLIADSDEEAFAFADHVPMRAAMHATPAVKAWVKNPECPWTRCTYTKLKDIEAMGVEAYLREKRLVHGS